MSRRVRAMAASLRSGRSESSWRERGIASGVRGVMRILSGISRRWFAGLRRREWPRQSRRPATPILDAWVRLGQVNRESLGWFVTIRAGGNDGDTDRFGRIAVAHGKPFFWDRHNTTVEVGQSVGLLTVLGLRGLVGFS
jgi:hypothetical protein